MPTTYWGGAADLTDYNSVIHLVQGRRSAMADLPTGTVTFLFTDIEGSTALWEQHPTAMRHALVRHDVLVEQLVAAHQGQVVRPRGEGDSRFAVFARATDAVAAAAALQQAFYAEPWPTSTPLRVRMALHTGEADLRQGDYYGPAVNRWARLRAAAHGGQPPPSPSTPVLVRGPPPRFPAAAHAGPPAPQPAGPARPAPRPRGGPGCRQPAAAAPGCRAAHPDRAGRRRQDPPGAPGRRRAARPLRGRGLLRAARRGAGGRPGRPRDRPGPGRWGGRGAAAGRDPAGVP